MSFSKKILWIWLGIWIGIWAINLLSEKTVIARENVIVSMSKILESKKQLDWMLEKWLCELVEYKEKRSDWVVSVIWYRCNTDLEWNNNKSDYIITISEYDSKYIIDKKTFCINTEVTYWKVNDNGYIYNWNQAIINWEWFSKKIDDATCSKMLWLKMI